MKAQIKLIKFALKYAGKWHSYATDRETVGVICATVNLGIIKLNQFEQFTLKSEFHATQFLNAHN